ncbi:glutaredoxin domain-containing protein [Paenarthrobacter sp. R1]|uniref:glutaredoxin family protein n=1 Tax=Paenarthrobacter sp. R1 TaxID=3049085 RepID=UPI002557196F|nr:glutaredoxin domain-containing protein [Paenarthrobacter sp. R1]WIV29301.1 glutaredoxin domain-containing protein [Paenarthrobacter sp. R1]
MTSLITDYTVYTKPGCPNCDRTMEYFDSNGVTYTPVDFMGLPASCGQLVRRLVPAEVGPW